MERSSRGVRPVTAYDPGQAKPSNAPHEAATQPKITSLAIVVPTRNEADNIAVLVERLEQALPAMALEMIFVDDSDDGTVAAIQAVQAYAASEIQVIHRSVEQRGDGLGGAVVTGLRAARAPWVCVMDADLQHPPELIPRLLTQVEQTDAQLVIASRYCDDGTTGDFGQGRKVLSRTSAMTAQILFPGHLRKISDPLSGFFLVYTPALHLDQLQPQGFKILLEILVRTPRLKVAEVGFQFGARHAGQSKASLREGMRYLGHLSRLRFNDDTRRFARFLLVGLSGLFVNMLLLALATEALGVHYLWSAVLATQGSTLWNFALSEFWVFPGNQQSEGRTLRLMMFLAMNNLALTLRGPMIYLLTDSLGMYYLLSNFISLVALTVVRYAVADHVIWGRTTPSQRQIFGYDIHGIITVNSEVRLPELERFLQPSPLQQPTISVRIAHVTSRPQPADAPNVRQIYYAEKLGRFGFATAITVGEQIDVRVSRLLRYSPHVLYTNVVEPILRWTFVEKGYALVHGACIASGEDAYLVTARTDTGKTTTMLRILARQRRATDRVAFLSDDLTLVAADGKVLTYPKPLTISHHTVRAINSALLSRRERLTLPFQSRIHSRSGRRFAFFLSRTNLPVATINTIVQLVVPPPKYHVQRLVPNAKTAQQARLAGMFIIERDGDGNVELESSEAFEILMHNCEDAYGFPPYPTIKRCLYEANGRDLQGMEREIVAQALHNRPTTLLRSSKLDWSERIPALMHLEDTRMDELPEPSLSPTQLVAGMGGA